MSDFGLSEQHRQIIEEQTIPQDILLKLVNDFENSPLPFFVDLSIFSTLTNPDLIAHIKRVGKCIYKRKNISDFF